MIKKPNSYIRRKNSKRLTVYDADEASGKSADEAAAVSSWQESNGAALGTRIKTDQELKSTENTEDGALVQKDKDCTKQDGGLSEPAKSGAARDFFKAVAFFSQVGITMAACVFVGVILGKFLDERLGTSPWLLLLFSLLGVGAAFKSLYDLGKK